MHGGLTLDFNDINSGDPPVCSFAMMTMQNWANRVTIFFLTNQIKVNETRCQITMVTLYCCLEQLGKNAEFHHRAC